MVDKKPKPKGRVPKRTGGNKPKEPWKPNPTQIEWFRKWTEEFKGPAQIAREHTSQISVQTVCEAIHKVGDWMREFHIDQHMEQKERVTALHEVIIQKAMASYEDSKGQKLVTTKVEGESAGQFGGQYSSTTTRTEISEGNPAYLTVAQKSASEINRMWGLNAPEKSEVSMRHAEEIEGLPDAQSFNSREEFIAAVQATLRATADAMDQPKVPRLT